MNLALSPVPRPAGRLVLASDETTETVEPVETTGTAETTETAGTVGTGTAGTDQGPVPMVQPDTAVWLLRHGR